MISTKSEVKSGIKAVSKSAFSIKSQVKSTKSGKSRTLKAISSKGRLDKVKDTKTVKSIKTVKTIDIMNLINGIKGGEKSQQNMVPAEDLKENKVKEEGELIYLDEETGLYYDQNGDLIEFNPDDFIIEE